jgi:hypothetical protein
MRAILSVLIFVSLVSANVPELRGTVEVAETRWVIPVDEVTLIPMPVYLDDGSTDPPRTLSPGACQMVASSQPSRQVTVRAHNTRMAVVQYHSTGFLDPHECDDGILVQVPTVQVHQWVQQAEAQASLRTDRSRVGAILTLACGGVVLLSLVQVLRALGRAKETESRPSAAQQRPGEP